MKTIIQIFATLSATAVFLHAQGTVNFVNSTATKVYAYTPAGNFPIPVGNPNPYWVAALYWGPEGSSRDSLTEIATTQIWSPFSGIFQGGTVSFPVAGGTRVALQVRAWNVATPYLVGYGPLQSITLGGAGMPPGAPASLIAPTVAGDTPFTGISWVPEPSSYALGLLALGLIALMRRRSSAR